MLYFQISQIKIVACCELKTELNQTKILWFRYGFGSELVNRIEPN